MRISGALLGALLLGSAGCKGPAGTSGPQGEMGERGEQGERGEPGTDGEQGPPGDATNSYRPMFFAACAAQLDLVTVATGTADVGTDGIEETALDYILTRFSNGDLNVSCTTGGGSAEASSSSSYYPAITNGASSGACYTALDYPPFLAGDNIVGAWRYDIDTEDRPSVSYSDPDHPLDGFAFVFEENDCSVYAMNKSGEWSDSSLGDAFEL